MRTIVKAEKPEEMPAWLDKFKTDGDDFIARLVHLKARGYMYYLNVLPQNRVSVGFLDNEFRPLAAAIFFKEEPQVESLDDLKRLISESAEESVPIYENRKHYVNMSSAGKSSAMAELSVAELMEWLEFFEYEPSTVNDIDELLG